MYFTKIELHNFGIYKGTHTMDLRNRIAERNITLVGGLNGRGKTTLHDAVLIALYGKQALKYIQEKARSYDRLLIDHINKYAIDEQTYIAVSLVLDDGTRLRVKRGWRLNGKSLDRQLTVEKNGIIDTYLGESWNFYVEEVLPFGIARFFFFNNEKITQLADDVSFDQIKSSIKSAIGVTAIEKTIDHIEEVIRRKKFAIQSFENSELNRDYKDVEERITGIDIAIADAMRQANELEKRCEFLAAKIEAKEKEFWSSGGELGRNREAIKSEMQKISKDMEVIQSEIIQMVSDASTPLFMCRNLVSQAYDDEKGAQEEEARRRSDKVVSGLYDRIMQRIDGVNFDIRVLAAIKNIISEELKGYMSSSENNERSNLSATSMMLFERLIFSVFQGITQRISRLVTVVESQESELLNLDSHLGNSDDKTMAMKLFDAIIGIEKEKTLADEDFARNLAQINTLKQQRENLVAKRIALIKAIAEKENSNDDDARIVRYAAMSIEVLVEFKERLQTLKLSRLSETITACFKRLVEKDSLVSHVAIDTRSLDITLLDACGNELLKSQLSAGEQQMFAISVVWALAETSGYKAPVLIDTPLARLDSSHRANFIEKLPETSSQVIVLSTDEEVYGRYLDLIRKNIVDYYTLLYHDNEQCTTIVRGYFDEV